MTSRSLFAYQIKKGANPFVLGNTPFQKGSKIFKQSDFPLIVYLFALKDVT